MKKSELYTIIITNYNNSKYLKNAINSVLNQKYNNIELIITDDNSTEFNLENIKKYIEKKKKKNIKSVKYVINDKNIGTIKTLNKAIKLSSGEYIQFFASDDELYDENVIENFVSSFKKSNNNIVSSQFRLCDNNMNFINNFNNSRKCLRLNKNLKKQYYEVCKNNIYGSGATSYRRIIFEKYGLIDTKYLLLEDWPLWLQLLNKGEKIFYENFNGLNHRDGGISKTKEMSKITKVFNEEIINTFIYEILPNIMKFNVYEQFKILKSFNYHIDNYVPENERVDYINKLNKIINSNMKLKLFWGIDHYFPNIIEKIIILFKYNIIVPISFLVAYIFIFILINIIDINKDLLLIIFLGIYFFLYVTMNIISNFIKIKKGGV